MERFFPEIKPKPRFRFLTQYLNFGEKYQDYMLIKYSKKNNINRILELSKIYKLLLIDPGVHELRTNSEYKLLNEMHQLVKILNEKNISNVVISIDYPCDMLEGDRYDKLAKTFIHKSIGNNLKYKNNNNYICCIQSKFNNFKDFVKQFQLLEHVWLNNPNKVIGIGNMCRIFHPTKFTDQIFNFIRNSSLKDVKLLHFYGLGYRVIKKYFPQLIRSGFNNLSTDSTKWTRAKNQKCKDEQNKYMKSIGKEIKGNGFMSCSKATRQFFFEEYIKEMQEDTGCKVMY